MVRNESRVRQQPSAREGSRTAASVSRAPVMDSNLESDVCLGLKDRHAVQQKLQRTTAMSDHCQPHCCPHGTYGIDAPARLHQLPPSLMRTAQK
ncbi:hypothetical protein MHYP_G00211390 [Metynnis hypsauchen]